MSLHIKGAVGQEAITTPEIIWNKHVDNGDCAKQQKINNYNKKTQSTVCQKEGCREKLTSFQKH
tara:strand:- start:435 stop:626 length:192 start_codon:yes stop_codon:yes gene_type:complete